MTSYVPTVKNGASGWIGYVSLVDAVGSGIFKANPTLAAGDVKISKDGGAFANLTTLPTVTPAAGKGVKITLSQTEVNADNVLIVFSDQTSPAEWCDLFVEIQTATRQIDDLAFPTVSGRSLDVTATGGAGIDWANVESPTTAIDFTNTTIKNLDGNTVQTGDSFARIGVAGAGLTNIDLPDQTMNITGNITGNLIGTVSTLTTYTGNTPQTGDSFARIGAAGAGLTALGDARIANLDATVSSRTKPADTQAAVTTVTNLTNAPTAGDLTATMKTSVENAAWNATLASHLTGGSTGAALNAAGSAGDPWTTALPGVYGGGTAGKIIGDNINATISSRLASASYTAPDNTDIVAIKAKTDSLTFTVGGQVDANIQSVNDILVSGSGSSGSRWGP